MRRDPQLREIPQAQRDDDVPGDARRGQILAAVPVHDFTDENDLIGFPLAQAEKENQGDWRGQC